MYALGRAISKEGCAWPNRESCIARVLACCIDWYSTTEPHEYTLTASLLLTMIISLSAPWSLPSRSWRPIISISIHEHIANEDTSLRSCCRCVQVYNWLLSTIGTLVTKQQNKSLCSSLKEILLTIDLHDAHNIDVLLYLSFYFNIIINITAWLKWPQKFADISMMCSIFSCEQLCECLAWSLWLIPFHVLFRLWR